MSDRPGGALAKRPLQFIWILDCSGSMDGTKIDTVNHAIRECIKPMQDVADENPNAEVLVRVLTFSDGAQWHVPQPTNIHQFAWADIDANGCTDMGHGLGKLADALSVSNMPERGLPPVLVLMSDGQPTDNFDEGLKKLMDQPWGKRAVRIAIAIGTDANLDVLQRFIGNPEIKPMVSDNAADLVKKIKWASTVPLKAASNPASRIKGDSSTHSNVVLPPQPVDIPASSPADVF
jgi:uncharacterized protein YegL